MINIYSFLFLDLPKVKLRSFFKMLKTILSYIIELAWLYAELHMIKIILLCVMFLAVYEVYQYNIGIVLKYWAIKVTFLIISYLLLGVFGSFCVGCIGDYFISI